MGHSFESETGLRYMELPDLLPYINKDRDTVLAYIKNHLKEHQPINLKAAQFFEFENGITAAESRSITAADLF